MAPTPVNPRMTRTKTGLVTLFTGIALTVGAAQQPGRSDQELGIPASQSAMRALRDLIGTFDLSATEVGSDGARFTETGVRTCRWALALTLIVCEAERTLREAVGRYAQLPAHRRRMTSFRWNASTDQNEQVDITTSGTPRVVVLSRESAPQVLSYTSVVESRSMQQTLNNHGTLTIDTNGHQLLQQLRSTTTAFNEEYREAATRQQWPALLGGSWSSIATHYHADGSQRVESGQVTCRLTDRTLACDRQYKSEGGSRVGLQLWSPTTADAIEIVSIGLQARVTQHASRTDDGGLSVTGSITLAKGSANTRGRWTLVEGSPVYRNETEEAPNRWRVDYEERLTRTP